MLNHRSHLVLHGHIDNFWVGLGVEILKLFRAHAVEVLRRAVLAMLRVEGVVEICRVTSNYETNLLEPLLEFRGKDNVV